MQTCCWRSPIRKRCRHRTCREWVGVGQSYCPDHKPYGNGWAAFSQRILARDNYTCRCTGCPVCQDRPCARRATTVDHVDGDPSHMDPMRCEAMCRPCNTRKGGLA